MSFVICDSNNSEELFKKDDAIYVKCLFCHMVYQDPLPSFVQMKEKYSTKNVYWENYLKISLDDLKVKKFYLDIISDNIPDLSKKRVLDFGCETGAFVSVIKPFVKEVKGIELSLWAVDFGREEYEIEIYQGNLFDLGLPLDYLDVITLWHSIGHLPNLSSYLDKLMKSLEPVGYLYIRTLKINCFLSRIWSQKWKYYIPNEHTFLFSKKTFSFLMKRKSLELIAFYNYLYKKEYFLPAILKYFFLFSIRLFKKWLIVFPIKRDVGFLKFQNWRTDPRQIQLPMSGGGMG